jgi:hypothetical protein
MKVYVLLEDNYKDYSGEGPEVFVGVFPTAEAALKAAEEYNCQGDALSITHEPEVGNCSRVYIKRDYEAQEEPEMTEYSIICVEV